jgi:hypothetical protein
MRQEIARFEEVFATFIELTYRDEFSGHNWKYSDAQYQANYHSLIESLLALVAAMNIAYDEFIAQELYAWSTSDSEGNPLLLPFTEPFLPLYRDKAYKASFLIFCLQSRKPEQDISTALIQACYYEVQDNLAACFGIATWLEFLAAYPNPASVEFIDYILPYINEDWYGQDLALYLPYVLKMNPGPAATALLAKWSALEANLEAARRI